MEQQEQLPAPIFALAGNECEYEDGEFLKCKKRVVTYRPRTGSK
jgi:hypothetical protein